MAIDPNWTDIVAAFGAFGVVVLGIVTFWFYRKEHRLNGLMRAFKVLNNQEHRNAREMVYSTFALYERNKDVKIFVESDRNCKS
jgi:hypothetical protein